MNVLTILGSPRLEGNTAKVLVDFETLIGSLYDVTRIDLARLNLIGCQACQACQATGQPGDCVQPDDGPQVLGQIVAADAVVYASPLYAWGFSAQMKALIDRHYCFVSGYGTDWFTSRLEGKPIALLVTCGGPIAGNADLVREMFARLAAYGQSRIFGTYILPHCTEPAALGERATELARRMESDLANLALPQH